MKNQSHKTTKGFSLLELIIALTIAGIIIAFAIPNYTGSVDRANEKDIINQMNLIHAAQNSYYARNGNQYMRSTNNVSDINNDLDLNIIANGNTYFMVRNGSGTSYRLRVTRTFPTKMRIEMTEDIWNPIYTGGPDNPSCFTGGGNSCPTLK